MPHNDTEFVGCLVTGVALTSLIGGSWLAAASVFGFGIVDTWVIYPERDGPLVFLISMALWMPPLVYYLRMFGKQKRVTQRQFLGIIIVISIIVASIAPLYGQYRRRQRYDEQLYRTSQEGDVHQ